MNYRGLILSVILLCAMAFQAEAFDHRGGGHSGHSGHFGGGFRGGPRVFIGGGFYPGAFYYDSYPYAYSAYYPQPVYDGYEDRPLQRFYRDSDSSNGSFEAAVERALAKRGYYRGDIDGIIGPMARGAIRAYQRDHDLDVTGRISDSLVRSLGLARDD